MIIGSFHELEVGKRYGGEEYEYLNDTQGKSHFQQPFVVLRIATRDEYVKELIEDGAYRIPPDYPNGRYYKISVD